MVKATLTSKGQLTVPKEVRDQLDIKPGDRLLFEPEGDSVRLRVERRTTLEELEGSLPARKDYPEEYPGKEAEREAARRYLAGEVLGERATP